MVLSAWGVYKKTPKGFGPKEEVTEHRDTQGNGSPFLCRNCKHGIKEREREIRINSV